MLTARQIHKLKAGKRKAMVRKRSGGERSAAITSVASANTIKGQRLDVSGVEVLDHEITGEH